MLSTRSAVPTDGTVDDGGDTMGDRPVRRRARRGPATGAAGFGVVLLAVVGLVVSGAAPAEARRPTGTPGAPGVGDTLYPGLGNGGFDVRHYTLGMRYDATARTVTGTTEISARATQNLSRFDLDFDGNEIRAVQVDGRPASYQRDGDELVITPGRVLPRSRDFRVRVDYLADPAASHHCAPPNAPIASGWLPDAHGFVVAGQPSCARSVFPGSDHPADKATYTFHLTAPAALTAVANGRLTHRVEHAGEITWTYQERVPMATELTQVAVGDYTVLSSSGPHGVRIRNVVPSDQVDALRPALDLVATQLSWLEPQVGRYPFDSYGILVSPANFRFALETQTVSLLPAGLLRFLPQSYWAPVMVHELAHQWYGDSVSPGQWRDVWLNEGHATWYEASYADQLGYADLAGRMRAAYAAGDSWRRKYGPVAAPPADNLFNDNVYDGGALVLFALREKVGAATFARIERSWASSHRAGNGTTAQFIDTASHVAHRDLRAFLTAWLYGTTTPPMPNHPDWPVDPA